MNRPTIDRTTVVALLAGFAAVALIVTTPLVAQPRAGSAGPPAWRGHHAGIGMHHPDGGHHGFSARHFERLAEHLELSEGQRQEAAALHESARAALEPIREESRQLHQDLRALLDQPAPDAAAVGELVLALDRHRDRGRQVHQETHAAFVALLTPEQAAKLEEHRDHRRQRGHRHGAGGGEGAATPH